MSGLPNRPTDDLRWFLQGWESGPEANGLPALEAYQDRPGGVWTIGWGHTWNVREGDTLNEEQAQSLLDADMTSAMAFVNGRVTAELSPNQADAVCSFIFALGSDKFLHGGANGGPSGLLRYLNAGDMDAAARQFGRWVNDQNRDGVLVPVRGLIRRRAAEFDIFVKGHYAWP